MKFVTSSMLSLIWLVCTAAYWPFESWVISRGGAVASFQRMTVRRKVQHKRQKARMVCSPMILLATAPGTQGAISCACFGLASFVLMEVRIAVQLRVGNQSTRLVR